MKFQIPRQSKPTRERVDLKLERSLLQKLERYCQYMESDRDYVISCMLQIVFRKDKGFAEWLRSHDQPFSAERSHQRAPQQTGA